MHPNLEPVHNELVLVHETCARQQRGIELMSTPYTTVDTANTVQAPSGALATGSRPQVIGRICSIAKVEALQRQRVDTDVEIKFSTYILWVIVLSIFTLGIGTGIYVFITYFRLITRRNNHFAREQALWQQVINAQGEYARAHSIVGAEGPIAEAQDKLSYVMTQEGQKNPWLHLLLLPLVTLGIWGFHVIYFLTVDWRCHADRHADLEDSIASVFRSLGLQNASLLDVPNVPRRNFWLYLGLTVVTLGLFGCYWLYAVMADGNNHMRYHAFVEDQAVGLLHQLEA